MTQSHDLATGERVKYVGKDARYLDRGLIGRVGTVGPKRGLEETIYVVWDGNNSDGFYYPLNLEVIMTEKNSFTTYEGWEDDLRKLLEAPKLKENSGTHALAKKLLDAMNPHIHDWRYAHLPSGGFQPPVEGNHKGSEGTVTCIAPGCPYRTEVYVSIPSRNDLPKYTGPDPWGKQS